MEYNKGLQHRNLDKQRMIMKQVTLLTPDNPINVMKVLDVLINVNCIPSQTVMVNDLILLHYACS